MTLTQVFMGALYPQYMMTDNSLDQSPPVTDTWYTVLDTCYCHITHILTFQENDETNNKTIELRVTIDGTAVVASLSQADDTIHYCTSNTPSKSDFSTLVLALTGTVSGIMAFDGDQSADMEGSIKVEIRNTSAAGTNQELRCVVYGWRYI